MKYMHYTTSSDCKWVITKRNLTRLLSSKPQSINYLEEVINKVMSYYNRKIKDLEYGDGDYDNDKSEYNNDYLCGMADVHISATDGAIEAPILKFESYRCSHLTVSYVYDNAAYTMLLSIKEADSDNNYHVSIDDLELWLSDKEWTPSRKKSGTLYKKSIEEAPAVVYLGFLSILSYWLATGHYEDQLEDTLRYPNYINIYCCDSSDITDLEGYDEFYQDKFADNYGSDVVEYPQYRDAVKNYYEGCEGHEDDDDDDEDYDDDDDYCIGCYDDHYDRDEDPDYQMMDEDDLWYAHEVGL